MSGFVIYYSIFAKPSFDLNFKSYFIKRFKRIYPLFIVALILAYVTECIYAGKVLPLDGITLIGNLANLQDISSGKPGVWVNPYYGNLPLWSLSYEWWFYMIFWFVIKIPKNKQFWTVLLIAVVGVFSYFILPNFISLVCIYLMIWWTGAELAKIYIDNGSVKFVQTRHLFLGLFCVLILLAAHAILMIDINNVQIGLHPVIELRHFFVTILFIALAIYWIKWSFIGFDKVLGIFSKIAPVSYAMYIFHYPFIKGIPHLSIIPSLYLKILFSVLLTWGFSYLMEMNFQKKISALGSRKKQLIKEMN